VPKKRGWRMEDGGLGNIQHSIPNIQKWMNEKCKEKNSGDRMGKVSSFQFSEQRVNRRSQRKRSFGRINKVWIAD
jgi:hypothetical protein